MSAMSGLGSDTVSTRQGSCETAHPEAAATEPAATPTQGGTPAEGNGGWVEYWNDDVGAHYYYNHITGINQWDMPEELKILKGLAGTTETTPDAETKVEGEQEKSEEKDEFAWSEEEPLDSAKADQVISWANENEEGLQSLNNYFEDNSYVLGYTPTAHDNKLFAAFQAVDRNYPHLHRWYKHIAHFEESVRGSWC